MHAWIFRLQNPIPLPRESSSSTCSQLSLMYPNLLKERKRKGMRCMEMRIRGILFIVKFLEAKKPRVILELKLTVSQKVARKQKASQEIKTPQTMANTMDRPWSALTWYSSVLLSSTGIATEGCPWGVQIHSFRIKYGIKLSKNLQNT